MKKFFSIMSMLILSISLVACQSYGNKETTNETTKKGKVEEKVKAPSSNPIATIEMQNGKKIEIELYYQKAPNTVANFITLADQGFYNNLTFHRVIAQFMIQGGDPKGDGTGGPDYSIKGEFSENKFSQNDIKHDRGVISMARTANPDSAGSQFFIVHWNAPSLDGKYAAFGRVLNGMDVVDQIALEETDGRDKPKTPQVIKTITVDKKDGVFVVEKINI